MTCYGLKYYSRQLALTLVCGVFSGCYHGNPVSNVFTGAVTKVHDGDSIHVTPAGERRVIIRLAAIDAPEIKQTHGIRSRDHLRYLIMNKRVTARCNKLDKYQRQVCVVIHGGQDVNLNMLETGHAWYYERFKDEQSRSDQIAYRKAAEFARNKQRGLWKDSRAIAPWDFRASQRN